MKKILLFLFVVLASSQSLNSIELTDTSVTERTGWLVYYLGHVIWFEADLPGEVNDKSFFTSKSNYKNGLRVEHIGDAKFFQSIAECYSIKSLTNIDTVTRKGEYTFAEELCIIPVKAKIISRSNFERLDQVGVSFKRKKNEVTMEYWFLTDYSVAEVELLRKTDKKKIK